MAEPMNIQTFGGAKVNMNDVESKQVVKDKKTGKETFVINFKNGIKVQYPEQAQNNQAAISSGLTIDSRHEVVSNTEINRFWGLELTGIPDLRDYVSLEGSRNCKIDVSQKDTGKVNVESSDHSDRVTINDDKDVKGKKFTSRDNTVVLGGSKYGDKISDHGEKIETSGKYKITHREGNRPEQLK